MPNTAIEFQTIHDTFRPKVLRYLRRFVGASDAEDLAQVVMVKVSESLQDFRGDSELSTWIYRIATNAALDRLRSPASQPATRAEGTVATMAGADDDLEERNTPPEAQTPSLETTAIRGEMNDCIREFIERLPANYKTLIILSELEGFKNKEIAEILGISLETVKIRLHRAREKLRRELSTGCSFYCDERNEFACDRKP
jgi:RNA polymerase sigma-70 factor (ECF subfamily)